MKARVRSQGTTDEYVIGGALSGLLRQNTPTYLVWVTLDGLRTRLKVLDGDLVLGRDVIMRYVSTIDPAADHELDMVKLKHAKNHSF